MQRDGASGAVLRQHHSARPRLGGRRKRGQQEQALGRSRGGFTTKIHLKTDLDGQPLDFHLTGGETSDTTQFETSLDIGPDIEPRVAVTDKGYDSCANRAAARARDITPVIPRRENSKQRGRFFPKRLYKLRARIEQAISKLKRFKRVALRCEKTATSYSAIVSFACGLMLAKSVHTAELAETGGNASQETSGFLWPTRQSESPSPGLEPLSVQNKCSPSNSALRQ